MYLSCKLGKANPLLLAPENRYTADEFTKPVAGDVNAELLRGRLKPRIICSDEAMFLSSLVTNVKYVYGVILLFVIFSLTLCFVLTNLAIEVKLRYQQIFFGVL